jgi:hypothetical protein
MSKFEMGTYVVCVEVPRDSKFLLNRMYYIDGQGDLSMNSQSGKSGFGFCIKVGSIGPLGPGSGTSKDYLNYFTEDEMNQYFITESEYRKIQDRELKLNEIGI